MKLIYENNGYKGYKTTILGYKFGIFKTPDGHYSFTAPMGKGKIKDMFDSLVYYNKHLYNGTDKQKIRRDIRNFIKNYDL